MAGHDSKDVFSEAGAPADLSHAGAVVDKAIEYMMSQNLSSLAIASALLGGSLGLLARAMSDEAILRVLDNAAASVRGGDLRRNLGDEDDAAASLPGGPAGRA